MANSFKKEIDFKKISVVFSSYGLGSIKEEHKQMAGDVDVNYKITATSGLYLLKYIENKKNIPQFGMLGALHEYLREKRIPVPKIYKGKNGNYIENDFILYEFIEGEIKKEWSKNEIISLVSNFARMLTALKEYPVPDFVKNKSDKYTKGYDVKYCHDVFIPKILELPTTQEIKNSVIKIINLLYGELPEFEKLPKFLVHGDLNEGNAIFNHGKNIGIIDFGVSYDPIVYDLGEFCYWFAFPWWTEEFYKERYDTIVETFEKILLLSAQERKLLPYMVLRRGMMDLMLSLQWYWENTPKEISLPEKRWVELIRKNEKIINELIF